MNPLWNYLWPVFSLGLILGVLGGMIGFRLPKSAGPDEGARLTPKLRRKRRVAFAAGVVLSIAAACLWHGPLGGADRFSTPIERGLHNFLVDNEMRRG